MLKIFLLLKKDTKEWQILTYETSRGEKPVDEFIKKQQSQARSKIVHNVRLLRQYGNMLGLPHSKALGGGLYELRIRGKEELRVFYCFTQKKTIYLLHVFKKQTRQTPHKDLDLALLRMRERIDSRIIRTFPDSFTHEKILPKG